MRSDLFKKFYRKMALQGFVKAVIDSLLVALGAVALTALGLWIAGVKMTWIVYIVFVVVLAISTALFYFLKYKPDDKMIARRLDETGLEERMITMLELEGDDSFIARRQREDANQTLSNVKGELLKFTLGVGVIVGLVVAANLAAGGVTVSYLHEAGKIDSLVKIAEDIIVPEPEIYYEVVYDVEGEGVIHGKIFQTVLKGTDCTDVSVEAEDGWVFTGWLVNDEDDLTCTSIHRKDLAVSQNLKIVAVFEEVDDSDPNEPQDLDDQSSSNANGQGGEPGELPQEESESNSQNSQQQQSDMSNDQPGGTEGGGQYDESNQIIDGETYYGGDVYDNAKNDAYDNMKGNDSISDGDKEIGSSYFDIIKN